KVLIRPIPPFGSSRYDAGPCRGGSARSFVIDNRPGAGSNIGTEAVAHAPADGYTLLLISGAQPINVTLYEHLNYNFFRDIAPVASISREPNLMVVHPSVPVTTVPEFVVYATANPGKVTMASSG